MLNDIRKVQSDLASIQVTLAKAAKKYELELLEEIDASEYKATLDKGKGGLKISVNEVPPHIGVYRHITMEDGNFVNRQYKEVRNLWYSLIKKATKSQDIRPISPGIVYIRYYLINNCDVGNFVSKFILDALVYTNILPDDDLNNLDIVAEGLVEKRKAPATEIYIVQNDGFLRDLVLSKFHYG